MLIPPVLYPVTLLPSSWQPIALLLPSSSAAFLVREAAGLHEDTGGELRLTISVLGVCLVGGAVLVPWKSRWRER